MRATLDNIVNVASVPQRSPFRYPGGKTWLVPHIRRWLGSLPFKPMLFVEPFAGGGIISLTVAAEQLAEYVVMVELDDEIAAVAGKRAGSRLYNHCNLNHEELFEITAALPCDFLMTYDDAEGVRELAAKHNFDTQLVRMKNTHHAKMTELLIGRDLGWVRL